jgi:hypothetical protein
LQIVNYVVQHVEHSLLYRELIVEFFRAVFHFFEGIMLSGLRETPVEVSPETPSRRRWADPQDLRRSVLGGREAVSRIVERSDFLPAGERELVRAVFRDGVTVKRLAMCGVGLAPDVERAARGSVEGTARRLRRRVRGISLRLLSPKFEFVVAHLEPADQAERRRLGLPTWSPDRRAIAEAVVVRGLSLREASAALGRSFHTVRREMNAVNALFEARAGK